MPGLILVFYSPPTHYSAKDIFKSIRYVNEFPFTTCKCCPFPILLLVATGSSTLRLTSFPRGLHPNHSSMQPPTRFPVSDHRMVCGQNVGQVGFLRCTLVFSHTKTTATLSSMQMTEIFEKFLQLAFQLL